MGLCSYSSVKYVTVDSTASGLSYRLLQFMILFYVVIYQIVMRQGYQQYCPVVAETFMKLKGTASMTNNTSGEITIIDSNDLVVPAQMENAMFITTNVVVNKEVQNSTCAFPDKHNGHKCKTDKNCENFANIFPMFSNAGAFTGKCAALLPSPEFDNSSRWCEIQGWCRDGGLPPKDPKSPKDLTITGLESWSLFLRLNSDFADFDVTLNSAAKGLKKGHNNWLLKDILDLANTSYADIALPDGDGTAPGAIILMQANFDCDLNYNVSKCVPEWTMSRIDNTEGATFSTGYNFYDTVIDSPSSSDKNGTFVPGSRTVTKRFGIKLEVSVTGKAGQFSPVVLGVTLGAGLGLLSVASLVTDFLLQHCGSKLAKQHFIREKFNQVKIEGAGDIFEGLHRSDELDTDLLGGTARDY